jgi:hypothetical protein
MADLITCIGETQMSENIETTPEAVDAVVNTETTNEDITNTVNEENAAEQPTEIDWKKEARKWEARAKSAKEDKDLADKWREYELSQKSNEEILAAKLAEYEAKEKAAEAKLLRLELAAEKGVKPELLDHLKGETREELEEAIDVLLSLTAESVKNKPSIKPNPEQGKPVDSAAGQITSRETLKTMSQKEIADAIKDGRLDNLLGKNK